VITSIYRRTVPAATRSRDEKQKAANTRSGEKKSDKEEIPDEVIFVHENKRIEKELRDYNEFIINNSLRRQLRQTENS
jgi:hypothetical protein